MVSLWDHGSKDMDDTLVKCKFLKAIQQEYVFRDPPKPDFHTLSSNDVLDEFVAMNILNYTTDNSLAWVQRANKINLDFKAKVVQEEEECCPEDTKYAYHEHMVLASRQFWGNKRNSKPNYSKNNSSGSKSKRERVRTCYNCGNVSHFIVDCPYENTEDNGGKLIHKDKSKSFSSKNNNYASKVPQKGLVVHEEYDSDDDDDDASGEEVARASMAIATTPSQKVSFFDSPMRTSSEKVNVESTRRWT
jgi:hypothetical protein